MPKPEITTTRDKLLVCGVLGAFMSLTIIMGNFSSPGSWSPTITTAAACYLIVVVSAAAVAGIRFLYRDWKTPPRHRAGDFSAAPPTSLTAPSATHADPQVSVRERPAPTDPPSNFATIDGAISYAQQSGFSIINLFTTHTPLSEYRDAVGAEIIYLVLSHIGELDKNASVTVSGSAVDGDLTLTMSVLTAQSALLGARRMGEIQTLIASLNGTVETNDQIGTWTLTVHIPAAEDTPA